MNTPTFIASLESAPEIIVGLIGEVQTQILKRRPNPNKWSAHQHPCHLATTDEAFLVRLELMLSESSRHIKYMVPSEREEAGALLKIDLDEALNQYVRDRARLTKRLKGLSANDWHRTAEHEEYIRYS